MAAMQPRTLGRLHSIRYAPRTPVWRLLTIVAYRHLGGRHPIVESERLWGMGRRLTGVLAAVAICSGLAGCSASGPDLAVKASPTPTSNVTFRLLEDGGVVTGTPKGAEGTITLTRYGATKSIRVGATGLYTLALPSGSYTVSGHLADDKGQCWPNSPGAVKVAARRTSVIDVICPIR